MFSVKLILADFLFGKVFSIEISISEHKSFEEAVKAGREVKFVQTSIVHGGLFVKGKEIKIVKKAIIKVLEKEEFYQNLNEGDFKEKDFKETNLTLQEYIFQKGSGVELEISGFTISSQEGKSSN